MCIPAIPSEKAKPILYPQVEYPEPVMFYAVEPKTKGDEDKLGAARLPMPTGIPHLSRPGDKGDDHCRHGRPALGGGRDRLQRMGLPSRRASRAWLIRRSSRRPSSRSISTRSRPAVVENGHVVLRISRRPARASSSATDRGWCGAEALHSRRPEGRRGSACRRRLAGYPVTDVEVVLTFGSSTR